MTADRSGTTLPAARDGGALARRRISVFTAILCLALVATFIGSLLALGVALYDRSVADSRNMAVALQQYALRTVTTAEIAAQSAKDRILARGGLRDVGSDRAMHDLLRDLSARLPDGSGIILVNPSGVMVASNDQFPVAPVDLSDRDWFRAHLDRNVDFLISDALFSRISKRKMFIMTLAVRRPDRSLVAIVNLGLPSDSLFGAQALPEVGSGVVLSLMKRDGGLLARSEFPQDLLGHRFAEITEAGDSLDFRRARDIDGRIAIEATETEPRYGVVARASIPLVPVFRPLLILTALGLPLLVGMGAGAITLTRSLDRQHRKLEQTTARLQVVLDASHLGAWHLDVQTGASEMNDRWAHIVGHEPDEISSTSMEWEQRLHPDEKDHVLAALAAVTSGETPILHIEHRLRHKDGHWVWVLDSGCVVEHDAAGKPRVVTGTLLDISGRREIERRVHILMAEVDHRSKNLLAVVHSLINLMPPDDLARYKASLLGRVKALGHVHTLLSEAGWSGVDLDRLVATEAAPYQSEEATKITFGGPSLTLQPAAAQAFAMVIHELMTNSAKYGALSVPEGVVEIVWSLTDGPARRIDLRWRERGGPAVSAPTRDGFGSRLLTTLMVDQLDGTISTVWAESGVEVTLGAPLAAIAFSARFGMFDNDET